MNWQDLILQLKNLNLFIPDSSSSVPIDFSTLFYAICYILTGFLLGIILSRFIHRIVVRQASAHHAMILRRLTFYIILGIFVMLALRVLGINMSTLLSTAGFLTAAALFIARTGITNFLSGIFLMAEKPFMLGDYVNINETIGEILSVDLLSVKLRTRDNALVRIPNEIFLNAQFNNLSRFPLRRLDIKMTFLPTQNLERLQAILDETALKEPDCLRHPNPYLTQICFNEWHVLVQFSAWFSQEAFNRLQISFPIQLHARLLAESIQVGAFPPVAHSTAALVESSP